METPKLWLIETPKLWWWHQLFTKSEVVSRKLPYSCHASVGHPSPSPGTVPEKLGETFHESKQPNAGTSYEIDTPITIIWKSNVGLPVSPFFIYTKGLSPFKRKHHFSKMVATTSKVSSAFLVSFFRIIWGTLPQPCIPWGKTTMGFSCMPGSTAISGTTIITIESLLAFNTQNKFL